MTETIGQAKNKRSQSQVYKAELDSLCKTLQLYDINKIVSYDDEWDFVGQEKYIHNKSIWENKDILEFKSDVLSDEELSKESLDSYIRTILDNRYSTTIKEILECPLEEIAPLKKILNEKFNLKQLPPSMLIILKEVLNEIQEKIGISWEFRSKCYNSNDKKKDKNKRILYIIDKDMSNSGGSVDSILTTIPAINSSRTENFDLILVYTSDSIKRFETHESKKKYFEINKNLIGDISQEDICLLAYQLWAFKKVENKLVLIRKFIEILNRATFGHSLHDYLESKVKYTKKSMLRLLSFSENDFESLYEDSFIEGELIIDSLDRICSSVTSQVKLDSLEDNQYINVLKNVMQVSSAKNIATQNKINDKNPRGLEKYRKLVNQNRIIQKLYQGIATYGLVDYSVNKYYSNIQTGDIFSFIEYESGKRKFGILISPSCDLVVRYSKNELNDKEIKRNLNSVALLVCDGIVVPDPLPEDSKQLNKLIETANNSLWPIKFIQNDSTNYYILDASEKSNIVFVDAKVLDLCSLNLDGYATIREDYSNIEIFKTDHFNKFIHGTITPWKNSITKATTYYNFGADNVAATSDNSSSIESASTSTSATEEVPNITDEILDIFLGLKYYFRYNRDNNRFEMQRIGRLESSHSLELIQRKLNNIGRSGVEGINFLPTQL